MRNWEKYEKEIKRVGSVAKANGLLCHCETIECTQCDFNPPNIFNDCEVIKMEWLYQEYEEPKAILTLKEQHFLEGLGDIEYYVARDEEDCLAMYDMKPFKEEYEWGYSDCCSSCLEINKELFKFIKWEDNEPWSTRDLLKLEVE